MTDPRPTETREIKEEPPLFRFEERPDLDFGDLTVEQVQKQLRVLGKKLDDVDWDEMGQVISECQEDDHPNDSEAIVAFFAKRGLLFIATT